MLQANIDNNDAASDHLSPESPSYWAQFPEPAVHEYDELV